MLRAQVRQNASRIEQDSLKQKSCNRFVQDLCEICARLKVPRFSVEQAKVQQNCNRFFKMSASRYLAQNVQQNCSRLLTVSDRDVVKYKNKYKSMYVCWNYVLFDTLLLVKIHISCNESAALLEEDFWHKISCARLATICCTHSWPECSHTLSQVLLKSATRRLSQDVLHKSAVTLLKIILLSWSISDMHVFCSKSAARFLQKICARGPQQIYTVSKKQTTHDLAQDYLKVDILRKSCARIEKEIVTRDHSRQ